MEKLKNFVCKNGYCILSLLLMLVAVLCPGGVMMAAASAVADTMGDATSGAGLVNARDTGVAGPGQAASHIGNDQMPGQATTVSNMAGAAGQGGDGLIQPDIDEQITLIATDEAVLNTIKHRVKRVVPVTGFEVDHYLVDEPKFESSFTTGYTNTAGSEKYSMSLASLIPSADYNMFYQGLTFFVEGVYGYNETGAATTSEYLVMFVSGKDSNDAPIVRAINGPKLATTDEMCYIPTIAVDSKIVVLDTAGYETQKFITPSTLFPVPQRMYLQKRLVNSIVSDYYEAQKKRIPFSKATIAEAIIRKWRLENNRGDWMNVKRKFVVKANDPVLGNQYAYTAQGLRWQFKRDYNLAGTLTFGDFIELAKFKFTGFDCSKEALWLVGRDLLSDVQSLDFTLHKDITITSGETFGLKCKRIETVFGNINIVHDPTLDKIGFSHCGALLDEKGLVRYVNKNEQKNNERVEGEEATRDIVMTIDCLCLKGYSHVWVNGTGVVGNSGSALQVIPITSAPTSPATGLVYICTTTVSLSINGAAAANQTAGTVVYYDESGKFQYYTGDLYAS